MKLYQVEIKQNEEWEHLKFGPGRDSFYSRREAEQAATQYKHRFPYSISLRVRLVR